MLTEVQINLRSRNKFLLWRICIPFLLMCPSLWCHSVVSTPVESKEIEYSLLPVHKYNVPTFSPFVITNDHLMTFHVLSVNIDIQPSLSNWPVEIRLFLKFGICLTSFNNHWFSLLCFIFTFPFQQFCMVHHHPNEPVQNHFEHNLENVSYGVWHEMKPLNLLPKTHKYYL